jgi:hypothetical protein
LTDVGEQFRLPKLPSAELSLHDAGRSPASARLRDILYETLPPELDRQRHRVPAKPRLKLVQLKKSKGGSTKNSRF